MPFSKTDLEGLDLFRNVLDRDRPAGMWNCAESAARSTIARLEIRGSPRPLLPILRCLAFHRSQLYLGSEQVISRSLQNYRISYNSRQAVDARALLTRTALRRSFCSSACWLESGRCRSARRRSGSLKAFRYRAQSSDRWRTRWYKGTKSATCAFLEYQTTLRPTFV